MRNRKKKLLSVLLLTVLILTNIFTGLIPGVSAEENNPHDINDPNNPYKDYVYSFWYENDTSETLNKRLHVFDLRNPDPGTNTYWAYCVDPHVAFNNNYPYNVYIDDNGNIAAEFQDKIRWILNNSFPVLTYQEINAKYGINIASDNIAYDATQSAIWNIVTNGSMTTHSTEGEPLYNALVNAISGGASLTSQELITLPNRTGAVTVSNDNTVKTFLPAAYAVIDGKFTLSVTGDYAGSDYTLSIDSAAAGNGVKIVENADGTGEIKSSVKNGKTFYISRPFTYTDEITITAQQTAKDTVKYLSLVNFLKSAVGSEHAQNLVMLDHAKVEYQFSGDYKYSASNTGLNLGGDLSIVKAYNNKNTEAKVDETYTLWKFDSTASMWYYLGSASVTAGASASVNFYDDENNKIKTEKDNEYLIVETSLLNKNPGSTTAKVIHSSSFSLSGSNPDIVRSPLFIDKSDYPADTSTGIAAGMLNTANANDSYSAFSFKYVKEGTPVVVKSENMRTVYPPDVYLFIKKVDEKDDLFPKSVFDTIKFRISNENISPAETIEFFGSTSISSDANGYKFKLNATTNADWLKWKAGISADKVVIEEILAPVGYNLNNTQYSLSITSADGADPVTLAFGTDDDNKITNTKASTLVIDRINKTFSGSDSPTTARFKIIKVDTDDNPAAETLMTGELQQTTAYEFTFPNGISTNSLLTTPGKTYSNWIIGDGTNNIKYYLRETTTPTGYIKSEDIELELISTTAGLRLKAKNDSSPADDNIDVFNQAIQYVKIKVTKKDFDTQNNISTTQGNEPLYNLYIKSGDDYKLLLEDKNLKDFTLYLNNLPEKFSSELVGSSSPNTWIANKDNFYIKETRAPSGYYLNPEYIQLTGTEKTDPYIVEFTADVLDKKFDRLCINLEKIDGYAGTTLAGAEFEIYSYPKTGNKLHSDPSNKLLATVSMTTNGKLTMTEEDGNHIVLSSDTEYNKGGVLVTLTDAGKSFGEWTADDKNFYLSELNAPIGYQIESAYIDLTVSAQIHSVSVGTDGNSKIPNDIIPEDGKFKLVIKKADGKSGADLAGAEFNLYKYDADKPNFCGDKIGGKITVPAGGYTTGWLDTGDYVLEEVTSPFISGTERYLLPLNRYFVFEYDEDNAIDDDKIYFEYKIKNYKPDEDPARGSVTISKLDFSTNAFLSGAEFKIFLKGSETAAETFTTDGSAKKIYLPLGDYILRETKSPAGYKMYPVEKDIEFTLNDSVTDRHISLTVYNSKDYTFILKKHELKNTDDNLAGATFRIYKAIMNGDVIDSGKTSYSERKKMAGYENPHSPENIFGYVYEFTTGEDPAEITLPYGIYVVYEIASPEGYKENSDYRIINLNSNDMIIEFWNISNKIVTGKFRIIKTDENEQQIWPATFNLYSDASCAQLVRTIEINNPGFTDVDVPIGKYWLVEQSSPFGYKVDGTPIEIYVFNPETKAENNSYTIVNEELPHGYFRINKVDWVDYKPLGFAEFDIYADSRCEKLLKTVKVDENGVYDGRLPYGTYYLLEKTAPYGYSLSTNIYTVTINQNYTRPELNIYVITNSKNVPPVVPVITTAPETTTKKEEETTTEKEKEQETTTKKEVETTTEKEIETTTGTNVKETGTTEAIYTTSDSSTSPVSTTTAPVTASTTQQPTTAPMITTVPENTTTNNLIPLDNGYFAEDLGDGLFEIYDENMTPLGYVRVPDGSSIEDYDVIGNLIPLDGLDTVKNSNPKTGDSGILLILISVMLVVSFAAGLQLVKKIKNKA